MPGRSEPAPPTGGVPGHPPCTACGGPVERRKGEGPKAFLKRKTCGCRTAGRGENPGPQTPWLSRYGGGYLSDAQWLAELMSARRAAHERRELPHRFWDAPAEREFFLAQLRHAHRLVKSHGAAVVLAALHTPEGKEAFSLSAPWLAPLLRREAAALAALATPGDEGGPAVVAVPLPEGPVLSYEPPPVLSRKNVLSRLRG